MVNGGLINMADKKMIKTSNRLCKSCKYGSYISGNLYMCNYLCMTYKRRNCPKGLCNKYEKRGSK